LRPKPLCRTKASMQQTEKPTYLNRQADPSVMGTPTDTSARIDQISRSEAATDLDDQTTEK